MPKMTGGQAVIEQLTKEGVEVIFGIPGVHTLDVYDALIDAPIKHVTVRHEQGAGFMADGYARTTGEVGVALVITGPGLTNIATPVAQAYSDSTPMLIISSQNPVKHAGQDKGLLHELKDQRGMMQSLTQYSRRVTRVCDIPAAIREAFRDLQVKRPRPIHLDFPTDVLEREGNVELIEPVSEEPPGPLPEKVEEIAAGLMEADKPLLLVGGGSQDAHEPLRRIVEALRLPVVSTTAGKGVIPDDHPLCLGANLRREEIADFASQRDLVLAIGTQLGGMDTGYWNLQLPKKLFHVDIDASNIGKNYEAEIGVVSDARLFAEKLWKKLQEKGLENACYDKEEVAELKREVLPGLRDLEEDDDTGLIMKTLRDTLGPEAVVVNDMTMLCYRATGRFPIAAPRSFLFPRGLGTLGFSPPAAYGAKVGNPERPVVALVGDGGFMFTVAELATAAKYGLAVPVIVLNNEAYGVVRANQERDYGRSIGTDILNPDFVALAESFGISAERLSAEEVEGRLPELLSTALEADGPTLIEIRVDF